MGNDTSTSDVSGKMLKFYLRNTAHVDQEKFFYEERVKMYGGKKSELLLRGTTE